MSKALDERSSVAKEQPDGAIGASERRTVPRILDRHKRSYYPGFYTIGAHATITQDCGFPVDFFLHEQDLVLDAVKAWFGSNEYHARDHLNIISADYVERSKLVEYAKSMNKPLD